MAFSSFAQVLVPSDKVNVIRCRAGKRRIREFVARCGVRMKFGKHYDGSLSPSVLIECTGSRDQIDETLGFIRVLLGEDNLIQLGDLPHSPSRPDDFSEDVDGKLFPMGRPRFARRGTPITLSTNQFKIKVGSVESFYRYNVSFCYGDGNPIVGKGIHETSIRELCFIELYDMISSQLDGKDLLYDGEHSLFTVGSLPNDDNEFTVVLNITSKTYKVGVTFTSKIPVKSIAKGLWGKESQNPQDIFRVFDLILRRSNAKQLQRPMYYGSRFRSLKKCFNQVNEFDPGYLGGGVDGHRGLNFSISATQRGLSLNVGFSTNLTISVRPVIEFLCEYQNVKDPYGINWRKANTTLKNLRIRAIHKEYKITGLSKLPCKKQLFTVRKKKDGGGEEIAQTTVFDYFVDINLVKLSRISADMPCIIVEELNKPIFFPVEICWLVPFQRYEKALSTLQRSRLVDWTRQKPHERMLALSSLFDVNNCDRMFGVAPALTQIEARVLPAPKIECGYGEEISPQNGRWNFSNKRLRNPTKVIGLFIVNFSAKGCFMKKLWTDLVRCAKQKGIEICENFTLIEEDHQDSHGSPVDRVNIMFNKFKDKCPDHRFLPELILCLLPKRKTSSIYGPWKKMTMDNGIITQCIAPQSGEVNDRYLTNVILKINAKLGGVNYLLARELSCSLPHISKTTMILGMHLSHGSPRQSDRPSIAAVVGSTRFPLISLYKASVRTQSPKLDIIDSLFKQTSDTDDEGIIRELLLDFYASGNGKPDQIVIFRGGVSESQFDQVLNIELRQIKKACKFLDVSWSPKFTLIVAQKPHHTKFFQNEFPQKNVPPGTVVDNQVCHPRNNDFYMCAHYGTCGTSRPAHYHVLFDEIGFPPDDLQELVYLLSYVNQRSTNATSVVAPIHYARLVASQVAQIIKLDKMSDDVPAESIPVQQLFRLHEKAGDNMFFC